MGKSIRQEKRQKLLLNVMLPIPFSPYTSHPFFGNAMSARNE